jgi:hypothetical protein
MKNYIVRVYRAHSSDLDSISGVVEDIESGQIEPFHDLNDLQSLLAHSVRRGQLELPNLTTKEEMTDEYLAVVV